MTSMGRLITLCHASASDPNSRSAPIQSRFLLWHMLPVRTARYSPPRQRRMPNKDRKLAVGQIKRRVAKITWRIEAAVLQAQHELRLAAQ